MSKKARGLDLGCGPGALAIPLSTVVKVVVAVDAEPGMIEAGRCLGAAQESENIQWLQLRAEDFPAEEAPFHVVAIGQAFHWTARDQRLRVMGALFTKGGGLALLNPGRRRPQES